MRRSMLVLATAALGACASRTPAPSPQLLRPTVPSIGGTAVSPATYVAQAGSMDLFVVRSSELALVRSPSSSVRNFASRMIAAHQGTAAQLSFAGRRLNLLPSASMLPQHQAMYDELETSRDFDRAYIRLQRSVHSAAFSLHSRVSFAGTSPTLRPVAANAAAVERSHLDMLRAL
jgi:putative membrane protein